MTRPLTYRRIQRALTRMGFVALRQRGSHVFFQHPDGRTTVVPRHDRRPLDRGLVRKIVADCGVTWDEFAGFL